MTKQDPRSTKLTGRADGQAVPPAMPSRRLVIDLQQMIDESRHAVAQTVNSTLVRLHWNIGRRIRVEVPQQKRAEHGEEIVNSLSNQLTADFGRGFGVRNLFRMVRFAETFPDERIVSSLMTQLSWTHVIDVIAIEDPLQREFYAEMCRIERWSVRTLQRKINSMLFERTFRSKQPAKLALQELEALRDEDRLTPDLVFRDPCVLDFLGLAETHVKQDLEPAIVRELEAFLLELGAGFAFVARQKPISVAGRDYDLDLLFFHRSLRRLVAIDLKLGEFEPADKGQMEFYLRWLQRHDRQPGEEPPLGLILCAGQSDEHVELLRLSETGTHVAAWLTELPPRELLERKLREAVRLARARFNARVEQKGEKEAKTDGRE